MSHTVSDVQFDTFKDKIGHTVQYIIWTDTLTDTLRYPPTDRPTDTKTAPGVRHSYKKLSTVT